MKSGPDLDAFMDQVNRRLNPSKWQALKADLGGGVVAVGVVGGLIILMIAGALALGATILILRGWALQYLWGLFMVPAFGLPEIGIVSAMGVFLVTGLIAITWRTDLTNVAKTPPEERTKTRWWFVANLAHPPIAMLVGYLVATYGPGVTAWLGF